MHYFLSIWSLFAPTFYCIVQRLILLTHFSLFDRRFRPNIAVPTDGVFCMSLLLLLPMVISLLVASMFCFPAALVSPSHVPYALVWALIFFYWAVHRIPALVQHFKMWFSCADVSYPVRFLLLHSIISRKLIYLIHSWWWNLLSGIVLPTTTPHMHNVHVPFSINVPSLMQVMGTNMPPYHPRYWLSYLGGLFLFSLTDIIFMMSKTIWNADSSDHTAHFHFSPSLMSSG